MVATVGTRVASKGARGRVVRTSRVNVGRVPIVRKGGKLQRGIRK